MANEIEIVVTGKSDLAKVERDAKDAGKKIGDGLEKGLDSAKKAGSDAAKSISQDLDKAADSAKQSGSKMGSAFTDSISSIGKGAGLLGAGVALGNQLWQGLQSEWEEDRVGSLIAAQTGAASGAAEGLGDAAGNLFADSFGSSIEDAGKAITSLFQNKVVDTGDSQDEIERLGAKVITVGGTMEEEFAAVSRSAQQAARTGLAESFTSALDLIQRGVEKGLNNSGELLDTIDEYGTAFREVGLNGQEAFGLMEQAQLGGARNIDIAADAIKEFGILTQDTASNASRGFAAIGLDGEKMGKMIGAGGDTARTALEMTLNGLRQMPAGIERNSAAVDLFGTKAEDLGDALFRMDLDTAADQFGEFAGSVEDASRKIAEGVSFWDKLGKGISNAAADTGEFLDNLTKIDPDSELGKTAELANQLNIALSQLKDSGSTEYFDDLKQKYPELADEIDKVIAENDEYISSTGEAAEANINYAGTFDDLVEAQRNASDQAITLSEASIRAQEALVAAHEAADEFGSEGLTKTKDGFDLATEAGREMEGSLNDIASTTWGVVEAMREEGATVQQVETYIKGQRGELIRAARQMGLSERAANAYADALIGIPKTVRTQATFEARQASAALRSVEAAIARIPRSVRTDYYMYTHALQGGGGSVRDYSPSYTGGGGRAHGGITGGIDRAATGGIRSASVMVNDGAGIGEIINVPDGSTVIPAGTTRALAERGMLGGGGSGAMHAVFSIGHGADTMTADLFKALLRKGTIRLTVNGEPVKVA
jgi:hypothetical protein